MRVPSDDDDDDDGQMIFGELGGLKLPDLVLQVRKNPTHETCPDQGSNTGPLRDRRACYRLAHSGGLVTCKKFKIKFYVNMKMKASFSEKCINRKTPIECLLFLGIKYITESNQSNEIRFKMRESGKII